MQSHHVKFKPVSSNQPISQLFGRQGEQLWLIVRTTNGMAKWCMDDNVYHSGEGWLSTDASVSWSERPGDDRAFRVYLDVHTKEEL